MDLLIRPRLWLSVTAALIDQETPSFTFPFYLHFSLHSRAHGPHALCSKGFVILSTRCPLLSSLPRYPTHQQSLSSLFNTPPASALRTGYHHHRIFPLSPGSARTVPWSLLNKTKAAHPASHPVQQVTLSLAGPLRHGWVSSLQVSHSASVPSSRGQAACPGDSLICLQPRAPSAPDMLLCAALGATEG